MVMFKPWPKSHLPDNQTYSMPLEYHDAGQQESFKLSAISVT